MKDKKIAGENRSRKHPAETIVLLPCSGASNCGQIANQAAVNLTEEGVGNMYCLAGIGAHIEGMVESAKSANRIVAIDGCSVACASKVIEHLGLTVTNRICVTDLGIEKGQGIAQEDISLVMNSIKKSLIT